MATKLDRTAWGVFIISATPFTDDGALDLDSADRLTDFYLGHGVSGITILGMMGEAQKLTPEEARRFAAHMLGRAGARVPVVLGVSAPSLDLLAPLAAFGMDAGAAGVMIAPPAQCRTETQVIDYIRRVADRLGPDIPLCYQDFPLSTNVSISAPAFTRLTQEVESLVMLKHEDWPGLQKLSAIRRLADETGTRRLSILTGNGGCYLPQELTRGADGAMTGFAFPEMLVEVVRLHQAGRREEAEDLFDCYLPVIRHEQMPGFGMAVRKEILRRRGAIASARLRDPGIALTRQDHDEITGLLDRLDRRLSTLGRGAPQARPA